MLFIYTIRLQILHKCIELDSYNFSEAIASIAPLDGSFEAVGDTDLIEETVVSLNKDDDKLDENNNENQQGLPKNN